VLTLEDEKYYEAYFDLFIHSGWKQLVQELKETLETYRIEDIDNESTLARVKGERNMLYRLVNFETALKETYESILESERAETV
jgi:hypothetical protein